MPCGTCGDAAAIVIKNMEIIYNLCVFCNYEGHICYPKEAVDTNSQLNKLYKIFWAENSNTGVKFWINEDYKLCKPRIVISVFILHARNISAQIVLDRKVREVCDRF